MADQDGNQIIPQPQEISVVNEFIALLLHGADEGDTLHIAKTQGDGTMRSWSIQVGRDSENNERIFSLEDTGEQRVVMMGETLAGDLERVRLENDQTQRWQHLLFDGVAQIRALADDIGRQRLRNSEDPASHAAALAQAEPAATTLSALYTVPASTETDHISIIICNRNNTQIRYRVSIAPLGAVDATSQYIAWDVRLPGRGFDTIELPHGFRLTATDVVRVESNSANTVFTLNGLERT